VFLAGVEKLRPDTQPDVLLGANDPDSPPEGSVSCAPVGVALAGRERNVLESHRPDQERHVRDLVTAHRLADDE